MRQRRLPLQPKLQRAKLRHRPDYQTGRQPHQVRADGLGQRPLRLPSRAGGRTRRATTKRVPLRTSRSSPQLKGGSLGGQPFLRRQLEPRVSQFKVTRGWQLQGHLRTRRPQRWSPRDASHGAQSPRLDRLLTARPPPRKSMTTPGGPCARPAAAPANSRPLHHRAPPRRKTARAPTQHRIATEMGGFTVYASN